MTRQLLPMTLHLDLPVGASSADNRAPAAVAVFLDYENVPCESPQALGRLIARLRSRDDLRVLRAYADWSRQAYAGEVAAQGVELIMAPSLASGKNAADICLVVDALELALTRPDIGTFVIASGDSDMGPLLRRLRALGRRVVVVARAASLSPALAALAHEVIDCEVINCDGPAPQPTVEGVEVGHHAGKPTLVAHSRGLALLQRVVARLPTAGAVVPMVHQALLAESPSFSFRAEGFKQFQSFLQAGEEAMICRLERNHQGALIVRPWVKRLALTRTPPAQTSAAEQPTTTAVDLPGRRLRVQ